MAGAIKKSTNISISISRSFRIHLLGQAVTQGASGQCIQVKEMCSNAVFPLCTSMSKMVRNGVSSPAWMSFWSMQAMAHAPQDTHSSKFRSIIYRKQLIFPGESIHSAFTICAERRLARAGDLKRGIVGAELFHRHIQVSDDPADVVLIAPLQQLVAQLHLNRQFLEDFRIRFAHTHPVDNLVGIPGAARMLGISRQALYQKCNRMDSIDGGAFWG